jgi:hypothetical protein
VRVFKKYIYDDNKKIYFRVTLLASRAILAGITIPPIPWPMTISQQKILMNQKATNNELSEHNQRYPLFCNHDDNNH